jgi:hemerythrin
MLKISKTGITEIDHQHEILIASMTELHAGIKKGVGREALELLMKRLAYFSMSHLAYEEEGMSVLEYPEKNAHFEQHRIFRERMSAIGEMVASSSPMAATVLLDFLQEWFLRHIEIEDVKYTSFVRSLFSG